ncbi:MAG: hypothetical protein IJR99_02230 [Kiritimatiellae bacterium]|nr:hypothetical protein [Kiritimatiellia bacterium]
MARSDITVLMIENGVLRGVSLVPRGKREWSLSRSGEWKLEYPEAAEAASLSDTAEALASLQENSSDATVAMTDTPEMRAIMEAKKELGAHQIVLGVPLSQLYARVLKAPIESREDLASFVALQVEKDSPYPTEELSISYEVLGEEEKYIWVFAAAWPKLFSDQWAEWLHLAKLEVVRTDAGILGWFRTLCGSCKLATQGRRVALFHTAGIWNLLVIDNGIPVLVRALDAQTDTAITREIMLTLMEVETTTDSLPLEEIVIASDGPVGESLKSALGQFNNVPIREFPIRDANGGVAGVALRTGDSAQLNLTPQEWIDEQKAALIRKRVYWFAGAAAAVWLAIMGVLVAAPMVYGHWTARDRDLCKKHRQTYENVSNTVEKVNLISHYADKSGSALEMLKLVCENLPEGITLLGFTYRAQEGVKVSGESDQSTLINALKDRLTAVRHPEEDKPLFEQVTMSGRSRNKGKLKFEVNALFKKPEEK